MNNATELARVTFEQVQAAGLNTGLVDNKVVSFSDEEYGIRFVIRKENRGLQAEVIS